MSDFNLFIYKIFSSSDLIQFHLYLIFKKSYLHLLYQNNLLQNFNLVTEIIFTCFYKKKIVFWKFQRILLKIILNGWFQFIYLQKMSQFIFTISFVFNFQKIYLRLLYKKIYYKISIWTQKLFLLAFTRK